MLDNDIEINNEKISVIMGIYNCAETLPTAIDSIINQTYTNWELIMCDDASTDNTYEVALSYKKKYPDKIILLQNEVNSKLSFSLNHCLKYANGKYVARMDGDDISDSMRFEKQINFLRKNSEFDLVGSYMQRFDGDKYADVVKCIENPDRYTLKNKNPFFHATILTYKRVYDKLGGYTVSKRTTRAQDYDLWFRFYFAGFKGKNLPEVLYYVRENSSAIKRRTFKSRWNSFKTTVIGFKLLNYPKIWIVKAFLVNVLKSFTPACFVVVYRKIQSLIKK